MNSVYENVIRIVGKHLADIAPETEVTLDGKLIDLGLNSIIFIKIIVDIEGEYDFELDDADLDIKRFITVKDFCDYLIKNYLLPLP